MTNRVLTAWRRLRARNAAVRVLIAAPILAVLAYSWMPAGVSVPNERSRVYLSVALVDGHTVAIDGAVERFGGIADLSTKGGRLFSDKAPGASFLGAAAYYAVRIFTPASAWRIDQLVNLMRNAVMIPIGLLGFWLLRRLLSALVADAVVVDVLALAWLFGTTAFHCSTTFMGHQIAAVSLVAALLLVIAGEARSPGAANHRGGGPMFFCAGVCAGMAVLTEYQSAIPIALLGAFVVGWPSRPRFRAAFLFAAGAAPGAVALLAYNNAAFGGPFELSYHHLANPGVQALHSAGVAGVSWPHGAYAAGGLFSLHRGLFTTSPIFLLLFPGLFFMWRRGQRRLALLLGFATAYYLLFISSTPMWYAGWGFGPRLLVPAMGWMMVPVAFAAVELLRRPAGRGVVAGLVLCGVAYHQMVQAVFPEIPESLVNPLVDLVFPALRAGATVPNLGARLFGLSDVVGLLPLAVLVAGLVGFLVLRLMRPLSGRRPRAAALAAALVVMAPLAIAVHLRGQTHALSTGAMITWMHRLSADERELWRQK